MSQGGGEQKKVFGLPYRQGVGVLCALIAFCLYMVYTNLFEGPPGASPTPTPGAGATAAGGPTPVSSPGGQTASRGLNSRTRSEEFHPILRSKRPEERIDPFSVDPTLKLDLLAKVQAVDLAGGQRNLFQIGAPKPVEAAKLPGGKEPVVPVKLVGPVRPPDPPPKPGPPPPPPITLKFYGFSTVRVNGKMTAYFLDGENILLAAEGDTLQRRYKVIRISAKSVLMEDTESKRQQTLPLAEETQG